MNEKETHESVWEEKLCNKITLLREKYLYVKVLSSNIIEYFKALASLGLVGIFLTSHQWSNT